MATLKIVGHGCGGTGDARILLRHERRRVMSKALGMRCVWGLCGVLGSVLALASVARAEVSTDVSGSVLVFPKVVFDGGGAEDRDTIIQISNTSNNMVHAHCFYVNGAPDLLGNPLWQITDFDIWLTRQQPTHWVASQGRQINPSTTSPRGRAMPVLIRARFRRFPRDSRASSSASRSTRRAPRSAATTSRVRR
jgi:hypothetical protein